MTEKNQCYFMGKHFDTLEELIKYEAEWQMKPLDQESADIMAGMLAKDIVMNAMLTCNMTNLQFKQKLNEIFEHGIKALRNE